MGKCCDAKCLTCPQDPDTCSACRNLTLVAENLTKCTDKCPPDMFNFENRRCVSDTECRNIPKPVMLDVEDTLPLKPYIPYLGYCSIDCPPNYYPEEGDVRSCKKCDGVCKKVCSSRFIDSISAAQYYRGCTQIKGGLIIQISSKAGREYILNQKKSDNNNDNNKIK